jgi:hypothetical protein
LLQWHLIYISQIEVDIYQHSLIFGCALPFVTLSYSTRKHLKDLRGIQNNLESIVLKTVKKEWNFPKLLRESIRQERIVSESFFNLL